MYLSKLELHGFKSFAQKTKLEFTDGLSCIIGPNGSGKSNIVDAIRWVLGEQKVTSLRSDKMENVIFNGTKIRKPMGMSEVALTVQNNKKILASSYEEIVIARRLFRSGESQYLINKVPVRLKDVIDLFMDTGMGANSYSVIELKMVESILSENKQERRNLFDEAAGIVKYKTRRKSALRKLEQTRNDLERLNDIIIEIEKNVNSLNRQVSKARRYLEYTDQLKKGTIDLATFRYHKCLDSIRPLEYELNQVSKEKEESSHQITLEEALLEDYNKQAISFEQTLQELNKKIYDKDNLIRHLNQEDAVAEAKLEEMKKNKERFTSEIASFENKIEHLNENIKNNSTEINNIKIQQEEWQEKFSKLSKERDERYKIINEEKQEIDRLNTDFKNLFQEVASEKELLKQKEYRLEFHQNHLKQLKDSTADQVNQRTSLKKQFDDLQQQKKKLLIQTGEIKKDLNSVNSELQNRNESIKTIQEEITFISAELEKFRSRKEFLTNIISSYDGLSQSTQYLMTHKSSFKGINGPLVDLINSDAESATLVETVLGDALNFIVVEDTESAGDILNEIKKQNKGRLTCIPLDKINSIKVKNPERPNDFNFLIDKLSSDKKYEHLLELLLGDIVIADNLAQATSMAEKYPFLRFVSKDGEIVEKNFYLSGGTKPDKDAALIGRKRKLQELNSEIEKVGIVLKKKTDKLNKTKEELTNLEIQLKQIQELLDKNNIQLAECEKQLHSVEYEINMHTKQHEAAKTEESDIYSKVDQLKTEIEANRNQLSQKQKQLNQLEQNTISKTNQFEEKNEDFRILADEFQKVQLELNSVNNLLSNKENDSARINENILELNNSIEHRKNEIENIINALSNFETEKEERKQNREQIWEERDKIEKEKQKIEINFQEIKDKNHELENQIRQFRKKHDSSLERSKNLEVKINEYKYRSESIREEINKEHSVDIDALIPNENLDTDETEEMIDVLRSRIKNLGPVNPLAISEYEKENERLQFLLKQREDLLTADKSLTKTIEDINKTARKQFLETFQAIKKNFEDVFKSFFVNGSGTISLAEHEDLLETDINIEVTTKGKGLQTLSLLSGGEKTLTAISLLFAIYLVKPSPFCILDEVDAPLDDVNITRFTQALRNFSKNTQFIIVTHNKRTMEATETMYGVTMEEEGISKLVSVKLN